MFGFKRKKTKEQEMQEALEELRAMPRPAADFTTPEGAILCLEDAMRRRDIEAAVASKDFEVEGVLMLLKTMPDLASDTKLVAQTAETLELAYRKELTGNWPNMEGVESYFVDCQPAFEDLSIVAVTEINLMPDGQLARANLLVAKRNGQWKVLHPVDDEEE